MQSQGVPEAVGASEDVIEADEERMFLPEWLLPRTLASDLAPELAKLILNFNINVWLGLVALIYSAVVGAWVPAVILLAGYVLPTVGTRVVFQYMTFEVEHGITPKPSPEQEAKLKAQERDRRKLAEWNALMQGDAGHRKRPLRSGRMAPGSPRYGPSALSARFRG